jgi:Tol biopolymer transport system component
VAGNIHYEEGTWRGVFDAAQAGTLIYQTNVGASGTRLRWYGRDGRVLAEVADTGPYTELALSRDSRQLVVALGDPGSDVWVYDLEHSRRTRLTFDNAGNRTPVWSPDGARIAFARLNGIIRDLYLTSTSAAGTLEPVLTSDELKSTNDWSPDGKALLFSQGSVARSVWWMPVTGDRKPQQLVSAARQDAFAAQFSPDGRWVAYTSNETGAYEIYVTRFPEANGKWQISTNGGAQPRWRGDGKTITYFSPDQTIMEARVDTSNGQLQVLSVKPLFKVSMPSFTLGGFTYDVTRDGKRFLINAETSTEDQPLTLVTNWTARLNQK